MRKRKSARNWRITESCTIYPLCNFQMQRKVLAVDCAPKKICVRDRNCRAICTLFNALWSGVWNVFRFPIQAMCFELLQFDLEQFRTEHNHLCQQEKTKFNLVRIHTNYVYRLICIEHRRNWSRGAKLIWWIERKLPALLLSNHDFGVIWSGLIIFLKYNCG